MKEKLLVSACLLGVPCRYDGRSVPAEAVEAIFDKYEIVPFCPEIYGGLTTPRAPSEIVGEKVINREGIDVTDNYNRGAAAALELCRKMNIKKALLKEKSPSCGKGRVYDGSFTGTLTDGNGITVKLLLENGIEVFGESLFE